MLAPAVRSAVVDWYSHHGRDLPWRDPACSPWGVLVSEVMLQQTPVQRVLPRWTAWLEAWPEPAALAAAPTADVLRAWDRLGYPRRALRLQECARAIVDRHGGQVPADEAALLALPGVGSYTAAAVMAFAFGRRSTVLDTNVRRLLARLVDGVALPPPHLGAAERERAAATVPRDDAGAARWAAASMELGALVCTARAPRCEECPVVDACAWNAAGLPPDQHGDRRRRQAWHGTDRQVRGRVMALLREHAPGLTRADVVSRLSPSTTSTGAPGPDSAQLDRSLAGLVSDGLAALDRGRYRLP